MFLKYKCVAVVVELFDRKYISISRQGLLMLACLEV